MENNDIAFKFKMYDKVTTPLTVKGIITMLGMDDSGLVYWVENNEQGVNNRWWPERLLADNADSKGQSVSFDIKLFDWVSTPLVELGIVTMRAYDESGIVYFISNNIKGAEDKWWNEHNLVVQ